jgi:two-component system response regulator NreC
VAETRPDGPIKVVLIDGQTLVREALSVLIDQQDDFTVLGHGASCQEVTGFRGDADVVLADYGFPDGRGLEVVTSVKRSFTKAAVLIVTVIDRPAKVQQMLAAGAHGYVLKTASAGDLFVGIRAVAEGQMYLQPSLGAMLARWHESRVDPGGGLQGRLSPKEEEVLRMVALGHTNSEVARAIGVSLRTVETHRARILQKLGRPTRAQLVRYAHDAGLFDLETRVPGG